MSPTGNDSIFAAPTARRILGLVRKRRPDHTGLFIATADSAKTLIFKELGMTGLVSGIDMLLPAPFVAVTTCLAYIYVCASVERDVRGVVQATLNCKYGRS